MNIPKYKLIQAWKLRVFSAIQATKDLNACVVREDHSLFINTLGIPGPYTNYMEKKISSDKLLKIINLFGDNRGEFEIATVCAKPDGSIFEYVFKVPMTFGDMIKEIIPRDGMD